MRAIKLGPMSALQKDGGGVRHCGRKSHQKSDSQDDRPAVGPSGEGRRSSVPYALLTRSVCECIAHALQVVTELDPEATITTIDGISAFDSISRRAMLLGLDRVAGRRQNTPVCALVPFRTLRLSLGGRRRDNPHDSSRRRGEQGDPLMPPLFSWQHASLEALQRRMRPTERLMAYRDDIYLASSKTHIWNKQGRNARVWRGSEVPTTEQGIKVLGTPLGHEDFVNQHLERTRQKTLEENPHTSRRPISMASPAPLRLHESELLVEGCQT